MIGIDAHDKGRGYEIGKGANPLADHDPCPCMQQYRTPENPTVETDSVAAVRLGIEDGTIQLFVDKPANNDLDQVIADMLAARATLDHRGVAHGGAGKEAERGMETRERIAAGSAGDLIAALVQDSAVLVGGGSSMQEASLAQRLDAAAATARARLFLR
jgi:hypothetical protein